MTKVLLTGANGSTGRAVLMALKKYGLTVRAFVEGDDQPRDSEALDADEVISGDMADTDFIRQACKDVDKLIHIGPPMGAVDVETSRDLIEAARAENVDHFIYFSVLQPVRRDIAPHRLTLDVEEAVVESGLKYTILQPARYMQHLLPIWPQIVENGVHAMPFDIDRKFSVVDLADVAEACAVVASSDTHFHATYELGGPQPLSQIDMAKTLSDLLDRPIRAETLPLDIVATAARKQGAGEDDIEQMLVMNRHFDAHGFQGNKNVLEYVLGRPAIRYRAFAASLLKS